MDGVAQDDGWSLTGALGAASELVGLNAASDAPAPDSPTPEQVRAHTLDAVARSTPRFHQDGQWTYAQHPSGAVQITEGPGAGTVLTSGKAYDAITKLMGPHPAQSAPFEMPVAPAATTQPASEASWPGLSDAAEYAANGAVDLSVWAARMTAGSDSAGAESQAPVAEPEAAPGTALDRLLARERLDDTEIGEARTLIEALPEAAQADAFEQLQAKPAYDNQRDNESTQEEADGGTCNLTSVGMAMSAMGFKDTEKLVTVGERIAENDGLGITSHAVWYKAVAQHSRAQGNEMRLWNILGDFGTQAFWTDKAKPLLQRGYGMTMGERNHVVRVQAVTAEGVVVDDPYGKANWSGGGTYKAATMNQAKDATWAQGDRSNHGEDNLWRWDEFLDSSRRCMVIAPVGFHEDLGWTKNKDFKAVWYTTE